MVRMRNDREELHRLIDEMPEEFLDVIKNQVLAMNMPLSKLTDNEAIALKADREERINNSNRKRYTVDELRQEFLDD